MSEFYCVIELFVCCLIFNSRYLEDCENNLDLEQSETLGQFVQSHGYCQFFHEAYLVLALSN